MVCNLKMLLGDISTWHLELKSVMLATMPSAFNLIPPSDVAPWGKTRNFAHPALKEAVIQFYYTGTYQIMDKRPESFNNSVPFSCLALVTAVYHCVLDGFVKNSTGKAMPQLMKCEVWVYPWVTGLQDWVTGASPGGQSQGQETGVMSKQPKLRLGDRGQVWLDCS
ncbi:hypothetical protein BKA82DRAFT_4009607 [Pisolithus tinctorius]|nr:hypothetical protein BKA82DRAFT_4009607 [Pisolithus tinctorius]